MPLRSCDASIRSCVRAPPSVSRSTTRYPGPGPIVDGTLASPSIRGHSERCIHPQPFGVFMLQLPQDINIFTWACETFMSLERLFQGSGGLVAVSKVPKTSSRALASENCAIQLASFANGRSSLWKALRLTMMTRGDGQTGVQMGSYTRIEVTSIRHTVARFCSLTAILPSTRLGCCYREVQSLYLPKIKKV